METLFSVFLLSLSSNLDTLVVAVSYGVHNIKISISNIFLICSITTIGTFFAMVFGQLFIKLLPLYVTNSLGHILLIGMGLFMIIGVVKQKFSKNPQTEVETEYPKYISTQAIVWLSAILTINNLGLGIAASITRISILYTAIFTFIITGLCVLMGTFIGRSISCGKLEVYTTILSGILLIILGTYEAFI